MSYHAGDRQSEPCAAAENLPHAAHEEQSQCEAQSHAGTVQSRSQHVILGGEHFRPSQNDTVYSNQFQKCSQTGIQRRHKAVHQKLNDRYERSNDYDIAGEFHLLRNHFPQQRDHDIGTDQHEHGRQAHADAVKCCGGNCQRRAHAQQSYQCRVFFQDTLGKFFSVVHAPVTS